MVLKKYIYIISRKPDSADCYVKNEMLLLVKSGQDSHCNIIQDLFDPFLTIWLWSIQENTTFVIKLVYTTM